MHARAVIPILLFILVLSGLAAGELSFLVLGDWGTGNQSQKAVASGMGHVAERMKSRFVVTTGDNFYEEGVSSVQDLKWQEYFVDVYTAPSLQVRWHAVLGNHDYRGKVEAQIESQAGGRWHMPARYFAITETVGKGLNATLVMLDTTPFINGYYNMPQNEEMRAQLRNVHWEEQLMWLKRVLSVVPDTDWLLVFGHHPIISGYQIPGYPGDFSGGFIELRKEIQPLLEQFKVDAYFCGHVHDLEHLTLNDVDQFISGAGAKLETYKRRSNVYGLSKFRANLHGFLSVQLDHERMVATFHDADGNSLYQATVPRKQRRGSSPAFSDPRDANIWILIIVFGLFTASFLVAIFGSWAFRRWRQYTAIRAIEAPPPDMIPMTPLHTTERTKGKEKETVGEQEDDDDDDEAFV